MYNESGQNLLSSNVSPVEIFLLHISGHETIHIAKVKTHQKSKPITQQNVLLIKTYNENQKRDIDEGRDLHTGPAAMLRSN
jgi:hypothetical protein